MHSTPIRIRDVKEIAAINVGHLTESVAETNPASVLPKSIARYPARI